MQTFKQLREKVAEGKMSEIDAMRKAGKSAQQIAKAMKIPVKIIKDLLGEADEKI
jgi:hypothetical protein|tara:strand:- start:238 stop:402 length:165 start_codon:yes stop_codon:yes gene_type:complete